MNFFPFLLGGIVGFLCGALWVFWLWRKDEEDRERVVAALKADIGIVLSDMDAVHPDLLAQRGIHLDA